MSTPTRRMKLALAIGAMSLAAWIGLVVVITPSGAGAREAASADRHGAVARPG